MNSRVLDIIKGIDDIHPALRCHGGDGPVCRGFHQGNSECIHKDPALAMRVLRMANSSFYRRGSKEIDTIHRAILMMGLNEVVNIATSVSVLSILNPKNDERESLRRKLCNHCIATALIARYMDKKIHLRAQGREFVGGLLHDIGKIIFDEYFHDRFLEAHELSIRKDCPMFEAEKEVIGATHMDVGSFLAQKWKLPPYLADIILHHNPADAQLRISRRSYRCKPWQRPGDLRRNTISFVLGDQGHGSFPEAGPSHGYPIRRITFEMEDIGQEVRSTSRGAGSARRKCRWLTSSIRCFPDVG